MLSGLSFLCWSVCNTGKLYLISLYCKSPNLMIQIDIKSSLIISLLFISCSDQDVLVIATPSCKACMDLVVSGI